MGTNLFVHLSTCPHLSALSKLTPAAGGSLLPSRDQAASLADSRFSASSLLTLVEMVDADLGITYLPEIAEGSSILAGTRVKTYPLRDNAYREIGLAWRRGSGRAREFRLLGEFIRGRASSDS